MKIAISKMTTFVCMVVVLGLQALLQGSWRVTETQPIKTNKRNDL